MKAKNVVKLVVSEVIMSLIMTGCGFNITKKVDKENTTKVTIERQHNIDLEKNNSEIDRLIGFTRNHQENQNNINYLIDKSENTNATFATLLEDKTITSVEKLMDGKKAMTRGTFNYYLINQIIIPESLSNLKSHQIDEMTDLINYYGTCDINCKKLLTLDHETLYYFDETLTFNSHIKQLPIDANEGDFIKAECLYKVLDDNKLELLYRNQTGYKRDEQNIIDANYNNENENIIIPLEDTIFEILNGEYKESYLREALDTYTGEENYYASENKGKDFSMFSK